MNNPLLSIASITYNHEKYIAQAVESWLMQKTDFEIEIVIGEDCSTDNTRAIIEEYRQKYPELIQVITSETNVGAQHNFIRTLEACKGKYIALCEGDDYWTDPLKLQKQVDFLELNPEYVLCGHAVLQINSKNEIGDVFCIEGDFSQENLFIKYPISTLSALFLASALDEIPGWFNEIYNGDLALFSIILTKGKGFILPELMGIHINHEEGNWSTKDSVFKSKKYIQSTTLLLKQNNLLTKESKKLVLRNQNAIHQDFSAYETINLKHIILGKINHLALFKYILLRLKKVIKRVYRE